MLYDAGNERWRGTARKTRGEVVRRFPQIANSLDFGAYMSHADYFVSYVFEIDRQPGDARRSGLLDQIAACHKAAMVGNGYPSEGIKDCLFASAEDCERQAGGNCYYYYK